MNLTVTVAKRLSNFTLDVDLTLPVSGVHAVVGPSGAGKSTLLRLIAGLENPDSGFIHFQGTVWTDRQLRVDVAPNKRPVGMVFQDFALFPHLTMLENVQFATDDGFWAESLMRTLGVWPIRFAKPDRISGGERQRCAICQALARKPQLLLLDEPFAALDAVTRRTLGALLRETADKLRIPMILVTHDLDEALTLSDSILTLVDGNISSGWLEQRVDEQERNAARSRALLKQKHCEARV